MGLNGLVQTKRLDATDLEENQKSEWVSLGLIANFQKVGRSAKGRRRQTGLIEGKIFPKRAAKI